MSLGLLTDYSFLNLTERRTKFAEYCGPGTTTEAIRKREDRLLQIFVETLQKRINKEGEAFIGMAEREALSSDTFYITDHSIRRLALPMMNR